MELFQIKDHMPLPKKGCLNESSQLFCSIGKFNDLYKITMLRNNFNFTFFDEDELIRFHKLSNYDFFFFFPFKGQDYRHHISIA